MRISSACTTLALVGVCEIIFLAILLFPFSGLCTEHTYLFAKVHRVHNNHFFFSAVSNSKFVTFATLSNHFPSFAVESRMVYTFLDCWLSREKHSVAYTVRHEIASE